MKSRNSFVEENKLRDCFVADIVTFSPTGDNGRISSLFYKIEILNNGFFVTRETPRVQRILYKTNSNTSVLPFWSQI